MGSRLSFNILSVLCVSAVYFGGLSGGGYFPVLSSFLSSFCAKASFHLSMSVLNFLEGSSSIGVKHCGQISLSPVYLSERTTTLLQLGQDNLIAIPVLQHRVDANTPLSRQCLQGIIYNRIWPELSLGLKANRQKEGRRGGQTPISRMKVQGRKFKGFSSSFILYFSSLTGLQSLSPVDWGKKMERVKGFEPSASTLGRLHSTAELHPLVRAPQFYPLPQPCQHLWQVAPEVKPIRTDFFGGPTFCCSAPAQSARITSVLGLGGERVSTNLKRGKQCLHS